MPKTLEFFFDYASPYSYLASTQIEGVANRTGAKLEWRPFLLGAVFKATGNVPPATNPYKGMYLMKDLVDWVRHYKLPDLVFPENFPPNSLLADRVGLVVAEHAKLPAYTHALYREIFVHGKDPQAELITEVLTQLGLDAASTLARAASQEVKDALRKNSEVAVSRGSFGAPTFFIGDDMYLGNDRLQFVEAALTRA